MKAKTLRWKLFLVLLLTMSVPSLMVSYYYYQNNLNRSLKEKTDKNLMLLKQYGAGFNLINEQLWGKLKENGLDRTFGAAAEHSRPLSQVEKIGIINKLNQIKLSNPYISTIHYFRSPPEGKSEYLDPDFKYIDGAYDQDLKTVFEASTATLDSVPIRYTHFPQESDIAVYSIVLRLPFDAVHKTSMIMINMDVGLMLDKMMGANLNHTYIVNEVGDVFIPAAKRGSTFTTANLSSGEQGLKNVRFRNQEAILQYSHLNALAGYLVKVDERSSLLASEFAMKRLLLTGNVALLVLCLIVAAWLAKVVYKPFEQMLAAVKEMLARGGGAESGNYGVAEMNQLHQDIKLLLNKNRHLQSTYQTMLPQMKDRFYQQLLTKGGYPETGIRQQAVLLEIDLQAVCFGVLALEVDSYHCTSVQEVHNKRILFVNLCQTVCLNGFPGVLVELGADCWGVLLFVNQPQTEGEFNQLAFSMCKKLQDQAEDKFNITVSCGIGLHQDRLSELHRCFRNVQDLLKYRIRLGNGLIVNLKEREPVAGTEDDDAVIVDEEKLLHLIQTGNSAQAAAFVIQTLENMSSRHQIPLFQEQLCDLLHAILKAVKLQKIDTAELFGDNRNLYEELLGLKSYESIREWLLHIAAAACEFVKQRFSCEESRLTRNIVGYIEKNYMNCDLSLPTLSLAFNLSPTHIGRVFKKEKGVSLMDYVNSLRIERSKELLHRSDSKIYEVGEAVGFQTNHYFIKLFKEKIGVTPGEYKKYAQAD